MKCVCCRKNEARDGLRQCIECADRHNETLRNRRLLRIQNKLCSFCGRNPADSGRLCVLCKDKHNESARKRRVKKVASGLCMNCGRPREKGSEGVECRQCKKSKVKWAQNQYKSRFANGMCVKCGSTKAEPGKKCCPLCALNNNKATKSRDLRRKIAAFAAYGGSRCNCCGEIILQFLTIDHIHNNGAEHRRLLGKRRGGSTMYCWLKRHKYPAGFQVLCFNCNVGRSINGGTCPHKQVVDA